MIATTPDGGRAAPGRAGTVRDMAYTNHKYDIRISGSTGVMVFSSGRMSFHVHPSTEAAFEDALDQLEGFDLEVTPKEETEDRFTHPHTVAHAEIDGQKIAVHAPDKDK